jgi:hypothetical protein
MNELYYTILRAASSDRFHDAINNRKDELYEVVWDLFETVVIEPAELFEPDFRDQNQFCYRVGNNGAALAFSPVRETASEDGEADQGGAAPEASGIRLELSILPHMSCLFSVSLQVAGIRERDAFRSIWRAHRAEVGRLLHLAKPMVSTARSYAPLEHAGTLDHLLDVYFRLPSTDNWIELRYPFVDAEQTETAQNFTVYAALLYHTIRDQCWSGVDQMGYWLARTMDHFSGRLPELPPPFPCVDLTLTA